MTKGERKHAGENAGNIVGLEHVNLAVPDQALATLFYVSGLGGTRDPYLMVGLDNMWVNFGEQQFHLPTDQAQVISGHIGMVVPNLEALQSRLGAVEEKLADTCFAWSVEDDHVAVTCPWDNRFRCYRPSEASSNMALGIPYVEFLVKPGAAEAIGEFYREALEAPSVVTGTDGGSVTKVGIGRGQEIVFREVATDMPPYDGHHIAVYIANFSRTYEFLENRGLITEDVANHQFRFRDIVDPKTGQKVFEVEHEVRSIHHPMYHRPLVNRDPSQSLGSYVRGGDAFSPTTA